jgi:hypothetical protein
LQTVAPETCSEARTRTKYLELRNIGGGAIAFSGSIEDLSEGRVLLRSESFTLDIDSNRAEYVDLHTVLVQALHGEGILQLTYIEEVADVTN